MLWIPCMDVIMHTVIYHSFFIFLAFPTNSLSYTEVVSCSMRSRCPFIASDHLQYFWYPWSNLPCGISDRILGAEPHPVTRGLLLNWPVESLRQQWWAHFCCCSDRNTPDGSQGVFFLTFSRSQTAQISLLSRYIFWASTWAGLIPLF